MNVSICQFILESRWEEHQNLMLVSCGKKKKKKSVGFTLPLKQDNKLSYILYPYYTTDSIRYIITNYDVSNVIQCTIISKVCALSLFFPRIFHRHVTLQKEKTRATPPENPFLYRKGKKRKNCIIISSFHL